MRLPRLFVPFPPKKLRTIQPLTTQGGLAYDIIEAGEYSNATPLASATLSTLPSHLLQPDRARYPLGAAVIHTAGSEDRFTLEDRANASSNTSTATRGEEACRRGSERG